MPLGAELRLKSHITVTIEIFGDPRCPSMVMKIRDFEESELNSYDDAIICRRGEYCQFRVWLRALPAMVDSVSSTDPGHRNRA